MKLGGRMYEHRAPYIRKLHKCHYCKRRLSEVPKNEIVAEFVYYGDCGGIDHFYCNADCARKEYRAHHEKIAERDRLNEYIEGEKNGKS